MQGTGTQARGMLQAHQDLRMRMQGTDVEECFRPACRAQAHRRGAVASPSGSARTCVQDTNRQKVAKWQHHKKTG
eukprot:scaffold87553_cov19-Tisochrysis_lutea.AAC.1